MLYIADQSEKCPQCGADRWRKVKRNKYHKKGSSKRGRPRKIVKQFGYEPPLDPDHYYVSYCTMLYFSIIENGANHWANDKDWVEQLKYAYTDGTSKDGKIRVCDM